MTEAARRRRQQTKRGKHVVLLHIHTRTHKTTTQDAPTSHVEEKKGAERRRGEERRGERKGRRWVLRLLFPHPLSLLPFTLTLRLSLSSRLFSYRLIRRLRMQFYPRLTFSFSSSCTGPPATRARLCASSTGKGNHVAWPRLLLMLMPLLLPLLHPHSQKKTGSCAFSARLCVRTARRASE